MKIKIETTKCYIYCTKANPLLVRNNDNFELIKENTIENALNGTVVGCFELSEADLYRPYVQAIYMNAKPDLRYYLDLSLMKESCVSAEDIINYGNEKDFYAWNIKNLEIFDTPRPLCAMIREKCPTQEVNDWYINTNNGFTKAPQSYCYAYNEKGEKCILISIKSIWVEKILNRIKTKELRKNLPGFKLEGNQ